MLSENGLPIAELEKFGFTVTRPAGPKEMLIGFDFAAVRANLYLLLETATFSGTSFVDFADETVEVERDGVRYTVFGSLWNNAYLIEVATDTVFLMSMRYERLVFVNTDLRRFVRCVCFFHALVQNYIATFVLNDARDEGVAARHDAMSATLRAFVADVDPAALDGDRHYWAETVYEFTEEIGMILEPSLTYYMVHGRFRHHP